MANGEENVAEAAVEAGPGSELMDLDMGNKKEAPVSQWL